VKKGAYTEQETEQLKSFLALGLSVSEIASRLDRAPSSVHGKVDYLRMTPEKREAKRERHRAYRRENSNPVRNWMHENAQIILSQRPSEEMLAERDERYSAPFRDLSGFAFGDPPIGYSALDREKRA
jgi:hypothetical protein